jgi:ribonuclease BN (tRNA processing enzyme)
MDVRLTVIGSSPAWPNPGSAHAGYLVEANESRLLLDCGPGVLSRMRRDDLLPVDAILISHLHLDHWGDLVPWVWFSSHGAAMIGRPSVLLPPGGRSTLDEFGSTFGHAGMFDWAFDVSEYPTRTRFDVAGCSCVAVPVEHYGMIACGFRIDGPEGQTISYSGDSGPCAGLAELAGGVDLFLCEATLGSAEDDSSPRGHLSAEEALSVADGRVLLTHRPAELPLPPGSARARDGAIIEVVSG